MKKTENNLWQSIKKPFVGLSPMDGITDRFFRQIVAQKGKPEIIFTEFTSVEALKHRGEKMIENLFYKKNERPIIAQLYGKDLDAFYLSSVLCCELGFDGIDINMGCPSGSVTSNGAGAALIKNPQLAQRIIETCKKAIIDWENGKSISDLKISKECLKIIEKHPFFQKVTRKEIPLSIKTRIGHDKIQTEKWITFLASTKPACVTIHGRTLKQMYTGKADWKEIEKAAKILSSFGICAIGNGDIQSKEEGIEKCKKHNLEGVLIGRAALGNPWIFKNKKASSEEKLKTALQHAKLYKKIRNENYIEPLKKHFAWYCKDFDRAKQIKISLMGCKNFSEAESILKKEIQGLKSKKISDGFNEKIIIKKKYG